MLLKVLKKFHKGWGTIEEGEGFSSCPFLPNGKGKEIGLAACYLSGQFPQDRLGIGWATLQEALKLLRQSGDKE
jgi:hypothetical protein